MRKWLIAVITAIVVIGIAVAIYFRLDWFRNVLAGIGTVAIVALSYYLLFPQNAKIILSHIGELGGWLGSGVRKFIIKNRVEGYFDKARVEFNRESGGAMPYPMSLAFVSKDVKPTSYLESGHVIVKLSYKGPAYMNVVDCALFYCRSGLLSDTREYLTQPLYRAINLETVDTILKRNKMREGRIYFRNEILPEEFGRNPETEPLFIVMEDLEVRGYFSRLLLVELARYPAKVSYKVARKSHHKEIEDFVDFLHDIANRPPKTEGQLDFVRKRLQVGVILVADPDKLYAQGFEPYLRQIEFCRNRGEEVVYLMGFGEVSAKIPAIASAAIHAGLATVPYVGRFNAVGRGEVIMPGHCARLELKKEAETIPLPIQKPERATQNSPK